MANKLTVRTTGGTFSCDIHHGLAQAVSDYLEHGKDDIWCCDENEKKDESGKVVTPAAHHCTKISAVTGWTMHRLPDDPAPEPGSPGLPDNLKDKSIPPSSGPIADR